IPPPPPTGWVEGNVVPYDLVVVGSDGTWELQCIAHVAARVDEVVQPLLLERPSADATAKAQEEFNAAVEKALQKVILDTLRKGGATFCCPKAIAPGGDNMSLALMLLL
ncbi:hypothetical protein DQ04_15061010, partial [Trypanosoma grayi]|uniref:hypothetical protein n=1 Tax=Trypanosoma grayi TaxID=71804 RepID=UPI0004F4A4A2